MSPDLTALLDKSDKRINCKFKEGDLIQFKGGHTNNIYAILLILDDTVTVVPLHRHVGTSTFDISNIEQASDLNIKNFLSEALREVLIENFKKVI